MPLNLGHIRLSFYQLILYEFDGKIKIVDFIKSRN